MTIISQFTSQEQSVLMACIVAVVSYLFGYYRGRHVESVENGEYFCSTQEKLRETQQNEINWLRGLIDDEIGQGDDDDN